VVRGPCPHGQRGRDADRRLWARRATEYIEKHLPLLAASGVFFMGVDPGANAPISTSDDQGRRGGMSKGEWHTLNGIDSARQQGEAWAKKAPLRPDDPTSPTVSAAMSALPTMRTTFLRLLLPAVRERVKVLRGLLAHFGSPARLGRRLTVRPPHRPGSRAALD
jgi:hypothetical protein